MKKKVLAILLSAALATTVFAACGSKDDAAGDAPETTAAEETEAAGDEDAVEADEEADAENGDADEVSDADAVDGEFTIGISQFAQHGSLDNCKEGFIAGLEQEGFVEGVNVTFEEQNSEADTSLANQIAQNYVASGVDLICAIATPSAQSAYNAAMDKDIPTIFTAVTDPIAAELATEDQMPVGNVTGTSDKLPVEAQLAMIREILPEAETIGIIYTTSEVNSETTIAEYEEAVAEYGFTLETVGVSTIADVPAAADNLLSKVDCLNNLTDNTVVSALATILDKANEKNIPVFGSEIEQVKIGCLAAEGIEYFNLGVQTGQMAAKVLKGEAQASEMPFEIITESGLYLNEKAAENLGIEISADTASRAMETFAEIE